MPSTFTRAPMVAVGDPVTSTQYRGLARAFNDRLRLVGDLAWRISWYWFTLWRQVRNSDSTGYAFPPQGEWFDVYAHIDPDYTTMEWPTSPPGTPEGANVGNPAMAFVFGVEGGPEDEPSRIQLPLAKPTTLLGKWMLGKDQRGAYDPVTTAQSAPAFESALSVFEFPFGGLVPFIKGYGGWVPQPTKLLDDCGDTEATGLGISSYEIKFTALKDDIPTSTYHGTVTANEAGKAVLSYSGTCPCGSDQHFAGHVLGVVRHPLYYVVYVSTGDAECTPNVDYIPTRDWIEGPYEAEPYLEHTDGQQLARGAWQFLTDFRGSDEQRVPDSFLIESIGFDLQAFLNRQYPLAPARGAVVGSSIVEEYPMATITSTERITAGSLGSWAPGQTQYAAGTGFVIAGCYAWSSGLAGPALLEILDGDTRIGAISISPDSTGFGEALVWLPDGVQASALKVRVVADVPIKGGVTGAIQIEFAELLAWKPHWWDAMVIARNGGSFGGDELSAGVDGRGVDYEKSADLTKTLFQYGCLINEDATAVRQQADWVNDNPLYDAMRRLTKSQVRITPRRQLVGYEVGGDGRSVLYFKRFAYGLSGNRVDMWDGIAPPVSPQWTVTEGETYIVQGPGGSVTYRGATFGPGSMFTAGADPEIQVSGDARVYIYDGIRHTAHKRGTTNEWVMFLETKCYHTSESSIWKPAAYSDYFTWNQRCLFYPYVMPGVVRQHVAVQYGIALDGDDYSLARLPMRIQTSILAPEAPTGYRFAAGTNTGEGGPDSDYCSSCRIYESPYEIESCTVDDWSADQVVKVVLKTRLRSHPSAPATVARNAGGWSAGVVSNLRDEAYRTDDNAVREYMRHQADGSYHCSFKSGDAGWASLISYQPDNPFGSCYPTFHCVRLVPEPYEDGNSISDPADTRAVVDAYQQMETYLRVICEAFVDNRTSGEMVCRTGSGGLYDYTFENLCYDAFGGRWIGPIAVSARPDDIPGFGPLPNTLIYAQVHNRIAAGVNLLTKLRIDLPITVSARDHTGSATKGVTTTPGGQTCTDTGAIAQWSDGVSPLAAPADTEGVWDILAGASMSFTAFQSAGLECDGATGYQVTTDRQDWEWKLELDGPYLDALPPYLRSMFDAAQIGLLAKVIHRTTRDSRQATTMGDSDGCCKADDLPCPGHWHDGGTYFKWVPTVVEETSCGVQDQGTVAAGTPPTGDMKIGRDSDMEEGTFCTNGSVSEVEVTLYNQTTYVTFALSDPA